MDENKTGSGEAKAAGMSRRSFLGASGTVLASGAIALALGGVPGRAAAAPLPAPLLAPLAAMTDVDLLNYALTLEHLENAFYQQGQSRFSRAEFSAAPFLNGFGNSVSSKAYDYFNLIAEHERVHVQTLIGVIQSLGGNPVTPGTYDFGYTDVAGYVAVAQALENTGVMAYDGALALIQAPSLQTAAATIATVEARHASYLNLLNGAVPFPAAFDTPKTMQEILAIAGPFIVGSGPSFKYTVQSGDNFYSIARRFGTTVDAIYQANNIPADKRNLLLIGTVLVIPGAASNR
ncbi:MAG: ferritin-like domain-containing protein [Anaerolineales bacterium]